MNGNQEDREDFEASFDYAKENARAAKADLVMSGLLLGSMFLGVLAVGSEIGWLQIVGIVLLLFFVMLLSMVLKAYGGTKK